MAEPALPNWQQAILARVGAPVTPQNLSFLDAWTRAEGGSAANNPFNTTQPAAGASSYNSVGVRNYGTAQQGIKATVDTLQNGRYGNILAALKQGGDATTTARALANSPWGTGSLVLKILGAGRPTQPPPTTSSKTGGAPASSTLAAPPSNQNLLQLLAAGAPMFGLDPAPLSALATQPSTQPAAAKLSTLPTTAVAKPKTGGTIRFLEHIAEPFGLTVTSTTGGKHAKNSYHYRGRAVDFGGDPSRLAALAGQALSHPDQFQEVIYTGPGNPGYSILGGRVIPNAKLPKSLFSEHTTHVHLAS